MNAFSLVVAHVALLAAASEQSCEKDLQAEQGAALLQVSSGKTIQKSQRWASSFHDVVGSDGALMISLQRDPSRFNFASAQLAQVGIYPTMFPATDADSAESLEQSCSGCAFRSEEAVADSHRRALIAASERAVDWTLILEDDVVPVQPLDNWIASFETAWANLPPEATFVRLGRCVLKHWETAEIPSQFGMELETFRDAAQFRVTQWTGFNHAYAAGGCNTAYVVHKSIIPQMLSLFPCGGALDGCWEWDLFNNPGQGFLFNIDTYLSPDDSYSLAQASPNPYMMQFGIIQQDLVNVPSSQKRYLSSNASAELPLHVMARVQHEREMMNRNLSKGRPQVAKDEYLSRS